ncbi:MAG: DUF2807 domain-containing protein [Dysgonomonas sp.]|nr:DUF2807 domain-containing protein [Dysgonomonas sp.]
MKTKSIFIVILIGLFSISALAQTAKEKRNVDQFSKISVSGGIKVVFTQGGNYGVELESDKENLGKVEVYTDNGTLILKRKDKELFKKSTRVTAYVSGKALESISISGGANFKASNLNCDKEFSASSSGGADIEIDKFKANKCKISTSGGADCKIKQLNVDILKLSSSGGAKADINIVNAEETAVSSSGGASISLKGKTKNVSISASGGAGVSVKGLTYETINSSKSGGGRVIK